MKAKIISLLFCSFFLSRLFHTSVYADYVLPYPSYMPGNKLYKISRIVDAIRAYWYWGSIASFKYHLELSDKYLVEAKTLFEYKQYLLATGALRRSNEQFLRLPQFLERVRSEGKDAGKLTEQAHKAASAHRQVLEKLQGEVPAEFTWIPEKQEATKLDLTKLLMEAIELRTL